MKIRFILCSLFSVVLLSGCLTTGSSGKVSLLQQRVRELESELAQKNQEIANIGYDVQMSDSDEIIFDESILKELEAKDASRSARKTVSKKKYVKKTKRNIQRALKYAGFYTGRIDGKIGKRSKRAIRSFQRAKGLRVDGVVGKRTWARMKKYL